MSAEHEAQVARWEGWLKRLSNELVQMHHNRHMFQQLRDAMIERAPDLSDVWLRSYAYVYAHSQAIAIRRVVRGDSSSVSLARLLSEMRSNPEALSADRYVALFGEPSGAPPDQWRRADASKQFEERWGDGSGHVSPAKLHSRASQLFQKLDRLFAWADKVVAHMVEEPEPASLTFADLHDAIDQVSEAFNDLALLLTASTWFFEVTVQEDWKAPFRQWLFQPFPEDQ